MYPVFEDLTFVAIVGFIFLILFVVLALWIVVTEGIKWFVNLVTQMLTRVLVCIGSEVKIIMARARLRENLLSLRATAKHSDEDSGLPAEHIKVVRAVRQLAAAHGHFRT
jgi:hypothetical protein